MLNRRQMVGAGIAAGLMINRSATAADVEQFAVACTQRGNWDTGIAELGQRAGIFKRHGLDLKILWSQGGGETQQAVLSGSAEIATSIGIMAVLGAYSKGAPVRVIGNEQTGAADLFWYVATNSPLKTLQDLNGETIAYSANGSSTHSVVLELIRTRNLKARAVATGGPGVTLTQVLSGQIAVGWSAPPFGLDKLQSKEIRIIATGNDAPGMKDRTVRVNITNVNTLAKRQDALTKFMAAYRETIDWMYADDAALKLYAEFAQTTVENARQTRDGFFPKSALNPDNIVGVDQLIEDAVAQKYTTATLTKNQIADLLKIPPR